MGVGRKELLLSESKAAVRMVGLKAIAKRKLTTLVKGIAKGVKAMRITAALFEAGKQHQSDVSRLRTQGAAQVKVEFENAATLDATPFWEQGNAAFYTEENIQRRLQLKKSERVRQSISLWWNLIPKDSENHVNKPAYLEMTQAIQYALVPEADEIGLDAGEEDWQEDTKGKGYLDERMFFDALFELADMWCEDIDEMSYAGFLDKVLRQLTKPPPWPPEEWKHHGDITALETEMDAEGNVRLVHDDKDGKNKDGKSKDGDNKNGKNKDGDNKLSDGSEGDAHERRGRHKEGDEGVGKSRGKRKDVDGGGGKSGGKHKLDDEGGGKNGGKHKRGSSVDPSDKRGGRGDGQEPGKDTAKKTQARQEDSPSQMSKGSEDSTGRKRGRGNKDVEKFQHESDDWRTAGGAADGEYVSDNAGGLRDEKREHAEAWRNVGVEDSAHLSSDLGPSTEERKQQEARWRSGGRDSYEYSGGGLGPSDHSHKSERYEEARWRSGGRDSYEYSGGGLGPSDHSHKSERREDEARWQAGGVYNEPTYDRRLGPSEPEEGHIRAGGGGYRNAAHPDSSAARGGGRAPRRNGQGAPKPVQGVVLPPLENQPGGRQYVEAKDPGNLSERKRNVEVLPSLDPQAVARAQPAAPTVMAPVQTSTFMFSLPPIESRQQVKHNHRTPALPSVQKHQGHRGLLAKKPHKKGPPQQEVARGRRAVDLSSQLPDLPPNH
ncbi:hypothetical protein CYMTET_32933, partial [Cymbomonas tetramitiformis]